MIAVADVRRCVSMETRALKATIALAADARAMERVAALAFRAPMRLGTMLKPT